MSWYLWILPLLYSRNSCYKTGFVLPDPLANVESNSHSVLECWYHEMSVLSLFTVFFTLHEENVSKNRPLFHTMNEETRHVVLMFWKFVQSYKRHTWNARFSQPIAWQYFNSFCDLRKQFEIEKEVLFLKLSVLPDPKQRNLGQAGLFVFWLSRLVFISFCVTSYLTSDFSNIYNYDNLLGVFITYCLILFEPKFQFKGEPYFAEW